MGLSRRNFIAGSAGFAALAAAGLAGCSNGATSEETVTETTAESMAAQETAMEPAAISVAASDITMGQNLGYTMHEHSGEYSFTVMTTSAAFDSDDKITECLFDTIEVVAPVDDDTKTVRFSGWPGQAGYETFEGNADGDALNEQILAWQSKRQMGDAAYGLNWSAQVDTIQEFFKGMTVAEVEDFFKAASNAGGKIVREDSEEDADKEQFSALTDEQKSMITDGLSGATISMSDAHGDFIGGLSGAYENRA